MINSRHVRNGIAAVAFLVIFSLLLFVDSWWTFVRTPLVKGDQQYAFRLEQGATMMRLAYDLRKAKLIKHPRYMIWLAHFTGATHRLKAGDYRIEPGTTPSQLLNQIVHGKGILYRFTLVPGWTFSMMMQAINDNLYLQHTLKRLKEGAIMDKIGEPGKLPEGRFFPETYSFYAGTEDLEILKEAYQAMQVRLDKEWKDRAPGLFYKCPYDALIAASLIEKETAVDEERAVIAGVIIQRIKKNMYLQLDPSVIYGVGKDYNGKITEKDLRTDTPYNTYLHKGLPHTPISMPSMESLHAALHPKPGKVLYYVAKGDGTGRHVFSENLKQHNKAVQKYQRHPWAWIPKVGRFLW